MSMIEVKTAELSGKALDWATWLADRGEPGAYNPKTGYIWTALDEHWSPHSDWSQGGPLIERFGCDLICVAQSNCWEANCWDCDLPTPGLHLHEAETALVAACRAIVAAKLGAAVSVPAELVQQQGEGGGK